MKLTLPLLVFALCIGTAAHAADELDLLGGSDARAAGSTAPGDAPAPTAELPSDRPLPEGKDPGTQATLLVSLALDRLAGLEMLIATSSGAGDRDATLRELAGVRQALHAALVEVGRLREGADLRDLLDQRGALNPPPAAGTPPAPPAAPDPAAVSADEFKGITASIAKIAFTTGKMQELVGRLEGRRVTTAQARQLVELFSFSRDRVDALIFLHARIRDPENFDGLLSALKFESDRASVRSQLGLDG